MSLSTKSLGFIAPGYATSTGIHPNGSPEITYVRCEDDSAITAEAFLEWLAINAFSPEEGKRARKGGMTISIVKDGAMVSGLVVSFDCTKPNEIDHWLQSCKLLIEQLKFRVTSNESFGLNEIKESIQSSVAWQVISSTASGSRESETR